MISLWLVDCIEASQYYYIQLLFFTDIINYGSAYSRVIPNSSHDVLLSSPHSEDYKIHQRRYSPILAANRLLEKVIFPWFTTSIWIIFRFRSLVTICAVSGSSLNPFVYVFRNESVRKEATRVVCWYVEFLIFMSSFGLSSVSLKNYLTTQVHSGVPRFFRGGGGRGGRAFGREVGRSVQAHQPKKNYFLKKVLKFLWENFYLNMYLEQEWAVIKEGYLIS